MLDNISEIGIKVPDGKLAVPPRREQNNHEVVNRSFQINGEQRQFELIHQLRAGDCVLANFLNTCSVELDGKLPLTINEARAAAITLRRKEGVSVDDILQPDSPLEYHDVVRLFSQIYDTKPKQEDILTVSGERSMKRSKLDALNILEYLDTYESGLVTTGLGVHSRTIKKLDGDNYALIDPMNSEGLEFLDTESMMDRVAGLINGRPENSNFFFFVRKGE